MKIEKAVEAMGKGEIVISQDKIEFKLIAGSLSKKSPGKDWEFSRYTITALCDMDFTIKKQETLSDFMIDVKYDGESTPCYTEETLIFYIAQIKKKMLKLYPNRTLIESIFEEMDKILGSRLGGE